MRSKFNSLLTEIKTPQTYIQVYIYVHIKPLPVPRARVFGARSGSPRVNALVHSVVVECAVVMLALLWEEHIAIFCLVLHYARGLDFFV